LNLKITILLLVCLGKSGPTIFVYTKHSQAETIPGCPDGYMKLWDGYSLLHTEDDGRAYVQDLGISTLHCIVLYCVLLC